MASSSSSASSGFTLHYEGAKFNPTTTTFPVVEGENKTQTKTEKLAQKFSNIGALTIRYHLGQGQRAGLIQQISRKDYESNPVQKPSQGYDSVNGHDQDDLFEPEINATSTCIATRKLEKNAHATLGKAKVLNERAQPLVHINREKLHGEQDLWGRIHAGVWHTGINLAANLHKQGFVYVCCPPGLTEEEGKQLYTAMQAGNFKREGDEVIVLGRRLKTYDVNKLYSPTGAGVIHLDVDHSVTPQQNGLVIDAGNGPAPLGWLIHGNSTKIVPPDMTEDLVRTIRIAQGGFYELTKDEQTLIQAGRLKNTNGLGLFEQNQTFNAMVVICAHLEKEYGFDPELLFGNILKIVPNRVKEFFNNLENAEDFLTGPILTEMVQSLRVTRPTSTRTELPLRFTNPFIVTNNNTKAIAYAFDAKYDDKPLIQVDGISKDSRLKDVAINGRLALPSLSYGKHAAAILSTAILVSEQMLLEQVLRDAYIKGGKAAIADVLQSVLSKPAEEIEAFANRIESLIGQAKTITDQNGPVLGLQFDYCDELVATLREAFGTNLLIDLVQTLEKDGILTDEALEEFYANHSKNSVHEALIGLRRLGDLIQNHSLTSAAKEGSAGINAGLEPLIRKIFPDSSSSNSATFFQVPGVTRADLEKKAADEKAKAWTSGAVTTTTANTAPVASSTASKAANAAGIKDKFSSALNAVGDVALRAFGMVAANAPLVASVAFMTVTGALNPPSL